MDVGASKAYLPVCITSEPTIKRSVTSMSQQAEASYIEQIGGYIADNRATRS